MTVARVLISRAGWALPERLDRYSDRVTQQYPPQQPYQPPWGQPQGWPSPQAQPAAGWNRPPQQSFGQPGWPQQPQQQPGGFQRPVPAGYPPQQQLQQPGGFRPPGQFNQAPRQRNPLGRVLMLLVVVCGLLLAGVVVANLLGGSPGTTPRPQDTWTPPPPDMNPSALPAPKTYTEATQWMQKNALYDQSITIPVNCSKLQPVDALNATEDELNAHLLDLTSCLVQVWKPAVEAAGFEMPRPPATVYSQPIQTACGKLESVNASYCGGDQRIYYAKPLPKIFPKNLQGQKFLMEMILGHEFGHAIQARTGISISGTAWEQRATTEAAANVFSRRLEVQADCLAGMWIHSVGESQGLSSGDLDGLREIARNLGDDVLSGKPNIDSGHGLGVTRQRWFDTGLTGSERVTQCNTYTVPDGQVR